MAGRWRDPSAFRADPAATPTTRPSPRQTVALLAVLVLVAGAIAVASYAIRPDRARAFDLFHGSLFLADQQSPVAVDLATGKPTLRLLGADKQVGVTGSDGLGVVPLDGGTLLFNRRTGEFNMVDSSGFVVKHDGGGVPLGTATGSTGAIGVAAGSLAYVVRNSADRTDVFLVSQATVTAALSARHSVTPRASTAMTDGSVDPDPGGAVSAGRGLWVLVQRGTSQQHLLRHFSYPADSGPGVDLSQDDHGTITGAAALSTATTAPATVTTPATAGVAVAQPDRIRVLSPVARTVRFTPPTGGVDRILAATSATGPVPRAPRLLADLPNEAMAPPAYSSGAIYTIDQSSGVTYRIGLDGAVTALAAYPIAQVNGVAAETMDMSDSYVISRGARVVVNSGSHANALMLFTDGSHDPLPITKSSAVQVNAAGGAEQLTQTTVKTVQPPPHQTGGGAVKPRQTPVQVVNPHLDCQDVSQKPHIPIIQTVQSGSRSVTLTWNYPIIDRTQDCFPTTYLVEIRSKSPNAPAPGSVKVTGEVAATITGLLPDSHYQLRVTAFINGEGTASDWFDIRTAQEGPAAPTGLTAAADAAGNWVLNWDSCGPLPGCVPVQSWTVTPNFCDARGLSGPPATATAPADPTTRPQPSFTYPGSDALLGRGLQFIVTGAGATQIPGTPSARTPCVYSWAPPSAATMTLTASKPANSSLGGTTSTTVRLDVAGSVTRAMGGIGAKIELTLTGPDGDHTQTLTYEGTGNSFSATFDGLKAGVDYRATAVVSAPGHPTASVQIGPQTVTAAADWPAGVGLDARCVREGDVVQLTCAFTAQISGVSSADVNGETFDVVDTSDTSSGLRCGNAFRSLARSGIDPAKPITDDLSLLTFNGSCTVTLVLRENGPVFGGVLKTLTASFNVDGPTTYSAQAGDWSARWDPNVTDSSQAQVTYQGSTYTTAQLAQITQAWTVTVRGPDGDACGSWSGANPPDGVDVPASGSCVNKFGDRDGWSVDITYQDVGTGTQHTVPGAHPLNGPPPTYQPCAPTDFAATWSGTADAPAISLTVGGKLAGCGNWTYEVLDSGGASCPAQSSGTPDAMTFTPTCGTPPSADPPWTVHVTWTDPAGRPQSQDVTVSGDPPQ